MHAILTLKKGVGVEEKSFLKVAAGSSSSLEFVDVEGEFEGGA